MANRGLFTILIVALGLGILFAGGVNVGYEQSFEDVDVTNESITVDYNNLVFVNEEPTEGEYEETVTVYNDTDALLTDGTDYEWYASNGSVKWYDTNATQAGEAAAISYTYEDPTEDQAAMSGALRAISLALVFVLFLLVGQWVFDVVGDW